MSSAEALIFELHDDYPSGEPTKLQATRLPGVKIAEIIPPNEGEIFVKQNDSQLYLEHAAFALNSERQQIT